MHDSSFFHPFRRGTGGVILSTRLANGSVIFSTIESAHNTQNRSLELLMSAESNILSVCLLRALVVLPSLTGGLGHRDSPYYIPLYNSVANVLYGLWHSQLSLQTFVYGGITCLARAAKT